jgi:hypothetical protein
VLIKVTTPQRDDERELDFSQRERGFFRAGFLSFFFRFFSFFSLFSQKKGEERVVVFSLSRSQSAERTRTARARKTKRTTFLLGAEEEEEEEEEKRALVYLSLHSHSLCVFYISAPKREQIDKQRERFLCVKFLFFEINKGSPLKNQWRLPRRRRRRRRSRGEEALSRRKLPPPLLLRRRRRVVVVVVVDVLRTTIEAVVR